MQNVPFKNLLFAEKWKQKKSEQSALFLRQEEVASPK